MTLEHAPRVAMLSVHTSPLDQPGTGDAGGMNVYVIELARALAARGARVEIFTRATSSDQPETVLLAGADALGQPIVGDAARTVLLADEVGPGVTPPILVHHVPAGPFERLDKNDLPGVLCGMAAGVLRWEAARRPGWYDVVHSHYWLSGQVGQIAADRWEVPLVHTAHTLARVKNASLAPGDTPEPTARVVGEEQLVAEADALVASTPVEAEELVELYGADPARVHVVEPGVDLDRFVPGDRLEARRSLGLPADRQIVLFAGPRAGAEGPGRAGQRAGRAAGDRPAGPAARGARRSVGTVQRRQGAPGARVDGRCSRRRPRAPAGRPGHARALVPRGRRGRDAVAQRVVRARRRRGPGQRRPGVAACVGGLRTIVDHDVSGRLVRGHDPEVWADVLADVLASSEDRARYAVGARQVAERFGWETTADQMLKVYSVAGEVRASRV